MATLVSPGTSVTVSDESQYVSSGPGTVPLIVIATDQDKLTPDGSTTAAGTTKANAGKLYTITSQRDLVQTFGTPNFYSVQGTPQQGYELNEYGLHAAYQYLGIADRAFVVRADVDLGQLIESPAAPTGYATNGTYWFDTASTSFGLFKGNGNATPGLSWDSKTVNVVSSSNVVTGAISTASITTAGTYTVLPTGVTFTGGTGTGAAGTVTGKALTAGIGAAGSGYTNGTFLATVSGGVAIRAATVKIVVAAGAINTVTLADPGSYTTLPSSPVSVTGLSAGSGGTISMTFGLEKILLTSAGSGYSGSITVGFTAGTGSAGVGSAGFDILPAATYGTSGDYAIITSNTNNKIYEKSGNRWYSVGSADWLTLYPVTATGSLTTPTVSDAQALVINGTTVTFTAAGFGLTTANLVSTINATNGVAAAGIVASNVGGAVKLTNNSGSALTLSGSALAGLGLNASYTGSFLSYNPHTTVPDGSHIGSVWIKSTTPNSGANYSIKKFSSSTNQWTITTAPFYTDDYAAEAGLAASLSIGSLYVQYNTLGTTGAPIASHLIKRYAQTTAVNVLGTVLNPVVNPSDAVTINGVVVAFTAPYNLSTVIANISAANIPNITAAISTTGNYLSLTNSAGKAINIANSVGTPLASLGITAGIYSNWTTLSYQASAATPTSDPAEGTLWYTGTAGTSFVDVMVTDGTNWKGYLQTYVNADPAGVILSSAMPLNQTDGTPLVSNDLWLNTADLENWPALYRYNATSQLWSAIDKTDQTTPFGIIFADARANAGPLGAWGTHTSANSTAIGQMLISGFVDPDAPNPQSYPAGTILFNTRMSTNNVKVWRSQWFRGTPQLTVSTNVAQGTIDYRYTTYTIGGTTFPALGATTDSDARWVTTSGNDTTGAAYMGRKAQRIMVVRALSSVFVSNEAIRAEENFFNLIACPGYAETLDEMVTLNVDRQEMAFIVADMPPRLQPSQINAWANNQNNAPSNGEKGRITRYTYSAMYYPWGLGTALDGTEVMVPSSTMVLRNYAYNDQVAYPWYPPAGTQRGVVTNAASVGYLTSENEYQPVILSQGQRDTLFSNAINPIAFIPNRGLIVRGDKTMHNASSALDAVNVARLVCYLRYQLNQLMEPFLFQLNLPSTRDLVKKAVDGFLADLASLNALSDYLVVCDSSNNTPERIDRNELWVDVAIAPSRSIRFIYVPIRIVRTGSLSTSG